MPKILSRLNMAWLALLAVAVLVVLLVHEAGVHRDLDDEDRQRTLGRHVVAEREAQDRDVIEVARPDSRDQERHHEPDHEQDRGELDVVPPVLFLLPFGQIGHSLTLPWVPVPRPLAGARTLEMSRRCE